MTARTGSGAAPSTELRVPRMIVAASALAFVGAAFVSGWYRVGGTREFGLLIPELAFDGRGGPTLVAVVVAGLAAVAATIGAVAPARVPRGMPVIEMAVADAGLLATALGFFLPRSTPAGDASFGPMMVVGIALAAVWATAAAWGWSRSRVPPRGGTWAADARPS